MGAARPPTTARRLLPKAEQQPGRPRPRSWLSLRTSTSSVVGHAGLLHPPDGAEGGRGQDRDAVAMGDRGRYSVGRSSSERCSDLVLAQTQCRGTQQTVVAARLDDRSRRSSSQRIRRGAAAPAQKQARAAPSRHRCFARHCERAARRSQHCRVGRAGEPSEVSGELLLVTFAEVAPDNAPSAGITAPVCAIHTSDWRPKREGEPLPLRTSWGSACAGSDEMTAPSGQATAR